MKRLVVQQHLEELVKEDFAPATRAAAKDVDWADATRSQGSCWGPNISDDAVQVMLQEGVWQTTPVIGGKNYEDSGVQVVPTDAVQLITCRIDGAHPKKQTLSQVLDGFGTYDPMNELGVSGMLSMRCATASYNVNLCFVSASRDQPLSARATTFSYSATDGDPQNLILVANTQGLGVFQDARGAVPLYTQARPGTDDDPDEDNDEYYGMVHNFAMEVKPDLHGQTIGDALEGRGHTAEQKQAVADLGEATQQALGPYGVPETAGVLIIKLPLKRKEASVYRSLSAPTQSATKGGGKCGQPLGGKGAKTTGGKPGVITLARAPVDEDAVMASVSRGVDMGPAAYIDGPLEQDPEARVRISQQIWITFTGEAPSKEDVKRGLLLREKFLEVAREHAPHKQRRPLQDAGASSIHDEAFVEAGITTKKQCLPPKITTVPV